MMLVIGFLQYLTAASRATSSTKRMLPHNALQMWLCVRREHARLGIELMTPQVRQLQNFYRQLYQLHMPTTQVSVPHDPLRNGGIVAPRPRRLSCNEHYLGDACSCCVAGKDGASTQRAVSPQTAFVGEAMAEPAAQPHAHDTMCTEETDRTLHRCLTLVECHFGDRYSCCVAALQIDGPRKWPVSGPDCRAP